MRAKGTTKLSSHDPSSMKSTTREKERDRKRETGKRWGCTSSNKKRVGELCRVLTKIASGQVNILQTNKQHYISKSQTSFLLNTLQRVIIEVSSDCTSIYYLEIRIKSVQSPPFLLL